jgi:chromate transporter
MDAARSARSKHSPSPSRRPADLPDPGSDPGGTPAPSIGLARLFAAFLRIGCTSFGGNTAGWLHRDIVLRRRWIDDATFLSDLALGQALPGSNGVKLTVQFGQRLHGAAGAALALAGLLTGPFAIVLAVGAAYAGFGEHPIVHAMLDGVAAAVVGLTFATGLHSAAHGAPGPAALGIVGATVLSVGVMRWPMLPVVAVLAPLSIALALIDRRRR